MSTQHKTPCTAVCFWCGKDKNDVVMLNDKADGTSAPTRAIVGYEPCDACKEIFSHGIQVIGVTTEPSAEGMLPIVAEPLLYPSGSFFVANEEWVKELLTTNDKTELIDDVMSKKVMMVQEHVLAEIIDDIKEDIINDIEQEEGEPNEAD